MIVLSEGDVRKVLDVEDAIAAVEKSFREFVSGRTKVSRSIMDITKYNATYLTMSALLEENLGTKIVAVYKDNPSRFSLPTVTATILLCKPETGEVLCVMDGSYITAMRTAAASALATKYLARKDSHHLGIIGTGVQGRSHLRAICKVRTIIECLAYDTNPSSLQSFVTEMTNELGVNVVRSENPKEVVSGSDIIVTATTSSVPVVEGNWLRQGTHINSIMSISPSMRELDDTTVSSSKIVVDDINVALKEAGDLVIPISKGIISKKDIYCELGDIIVGNKKGRESDQEVTLFKPVGLPSHDVCTAWKAYEKARSRGLGRTSLAPHKTGSPS